MPKHTSSCWLTLHDFHLPLYIVIIMFGWVKDMFKGLLYCVMCQRLLQCVLRVGASRQCVSYLHTFTVTHDFLVLKSISNEQLILKCSLNWDHLKQDLMRSGSTLFLCAGVQHQCSRVDQTLHVTLTSLILFHLVFFLQMDKNDFSVIKRWFK